MAEPSTEEEQYALLSELVELMRIARIARPGAMCDASVSAKTSETINAAIINLFDFEEIATVNLTKETGDIERHHIQCFDEFTSA